MLNNTIKNNGNHMFDQQLIAKQRHDVSTEALSKSAESFNQAQIDTIEAQIYVVEKMAFYSAGAISLSITFLGYLLQKYNVLLTQHFLFLPVYYVLYLSWICSTITIVTGIFTKKIDAMYRYYVAIAEYFDKNKTQQEKVLGLVETDYPIILDDGETIVSFKKLTTDRVDNFSKKIEGYKNKESFYFKTKILVQNVSMISFVLSVLLLTLFAILITNKIIAQ